MNITKEELRTKVMSINNQRVLNYKYLGATNTKQARVKIIDKCFKKSITIPYDTNFDTTSQVAIAYLMERGWNVCGKNTESCIIIMSNWNGLKQLK